MRSRLAALLAAPALLAALPLAVHAQSALAAAPSGRATSEVSLAPREGQTGTPAVIRLDYGQPHLRGRALHTDSLVPYGKPWRTGANAATTLTTGVDLTLGGASLAKGTYVLVTVPTRDAWTLVVQEPRPAGAPENAPLKEVARVPLRRQTLAQPLESFTMWLIPSTQPGSPRGELRMAWGTSLLAADWAVR